ncbi:MAG: amino acid adenylation domain-containing protein [Calothrix sp. FI2-JRJ7]|jgi:amino acid adenylation domain-containing protein|nr:amino acid adenylation domain-containing protein [Calothrix sp. FI2-JRJ7]
MKTIEEFLSYLCSLDIKLWAEGDRLRCNAPKEKLTPALKAELGERKAEILAFLRKTNISNYAQNYAQKLIQPIPREGNIPLSFAQQRLWFIDQFESGSSLYNVPIALHLKGVLNVAALSQTLNEIVRRHEGLRTSFILVEGQPVQLITPELIINLPIVDLQDLSEVEQKDQVLQIISSEAKRPFNLAQAPLLRASLLRLNEVEHIVTFTMHHIISDGWSMGVLVQEVAALYEAFSKCQPSQLPELPIQYADFALWQRQWLQGEVLESQLAYWQKQLGGNLPVLQLPTNFKRPKVQTFQGATKSFSLSKNLTEALETLSHNENVTLFMTLLAAFKTLLYRYTGQEDILVGSPVANRNQEKLELLIGFFVNTLVLRTDLSGNPSFRELLKRVREVTLGAYTHQDLPFEQLVEKLHPERNLSHTPLFQVMFQLQNTPNQTLELPGLTWKTLEFHNQTSKFDLSLSMVETESGLIGKLEYNTDLFEVATITRMQGHFQTLLEGIIANPEQAISDLPLLTDAEEYQLLAWNQTKVDYPSGLCIHQLFEAQVEQTPESIALVYDDSQLTYQELNQRANQLAHYLQTLGVALEVLVGICVERSLETVISILAILKAGGAYLPLDPAYPPERLNWMLEDAKVSVLLTQKHLTTLLNTSAKIICLDATWDLIAQSSASNLVDCKVKSENLAYVIYTSGSTGKSKGVLIQHNSLVNAYFAWGQAYKLRSEVTCHLQMASFSFDVFSGDLVRALCSGGKLVLCPRELLLSPQELYSLIQKEQVDCAEFVPAVLRNLMQYLQETQQRLDSIRLLICGSDSWYGKEYQSFLKYCSSKTRLINSYGVTEATIDSSYFESSIENLSLEQLVPIGRPFDNVELYILDVNLQPVPIGVSGELYIGGAGLARGYLNRPDLTAERFIDNPFKQAHYNKNNTYIIDKFSANSTLSKANHNLNLNTRLYKTGDLARYLPDGNIEFIRRIDYQVKVRGFRIEIGEVEAVLNQYTDVKEVVVVVREDIPSDKRLVAYIVPLSGEIKISELRRFLKEKLPDYMIPGAFVILESLPLTPNGKVNRKALPAPDLTQKQIGKSFKLPRTNFQEVLIGIWSQLLNLQEIEIGIGDNFFDLGGHSLLATQLISRIRQIFNVELPLRCVFAEPTINELAANIQTMLQQGQNLQIPPILPTPRNAGLPLSFAQARLWFIAQLQPGSTYNIFHAIRLKGSLNQTALEQSINEIIRRHEVLRTRLITVDGQPVQMIVPSLQLSLPLIDLQAFTATEQEAKVQQLMEQEAQQPFDLAQGSLLRITLLKLNPEDNVVFFTMHHIVSDAWSMAILLKEVAHLYEAFCNGKASPLPELPIQYADFAVWQREWLTGEVLETQLAYWKQQLSDNLPLLKLPIDHPRPLVQNYQGGRQSLTLPNLSKTLKKFSNEEGVTLFMTLLAAFITLLHYYTEQDDIVVGTDVANRNQGETEQLIGFFVNQLVLRTYLGGNPSFRELLKRVREVTLGAYAHQDLPFDKLVEVLNPDRKLNHTPLFQVKIILQNAPVESLEMSGLTLTPLEFQNTTVTHDLLLELKDTESGITGLFKYNTDLFDANNIARMIRHFEAILSKITTDPSLKLNDLKEALSQADKQELFSQEQAYQNTLQKNLTSIKRKSVSS